MKPPGDLHGYTTPGALRPTRIVGAYIGPRNPNTPPLPGFLHPKGLLRPTGRDHPFFRDRLESTLPKPPRSTRPGGRPRYRGARNARPADLLRPQAPVSLTDLILRFGDLH